MANPPGSATSSPGFSRGASWLLEAFFSQGGVSPARDVPGLGPPASTGLAVVGRASTTDEDGAELSPEFLRRGGEGDDVLPEAC